MMAASKSILFAALVVLVLGLSHGQSTPPAGWTCLPSDWDDGICDCKLECGVDDVACDAAGLETCRALDFALEDLGENLGAAVGLGIGLLIAVIVGSIVALILVCVCVYCLCIKESEASKQQKMMIMQQQMQQGSPDAVEQQI